MRTWLATGLLALGVVHTALADEPPPADAPSAEVSTEVPAEDAPSDKPPGECVRQIGGGIGMVIPVDAWSLLGNGPVFTGSPVLSLRCSLPGKVRAFGEMSTAPTQAHWFRELGQAGLYVMPAFGIETGRNRWRYSASVIAMPRLIGLGLGLQYRFGGDSGNWLTHNADGVGKGFELRLQVLDGDLIQYQIQLRYTFGVTVL